MNETTAVVSAIAAVLGAVSGGLVTGRVTRHIELEKHFVQLSSGAFVDFFRGIAEVAQAQRWLSRDTLTPEQRTEAMTLERDALVLIAEARARIATYADRAVVDALVQMVESGMDLGTASGQAAVVAMVQGIRSSGPSPLAEVPPAAISQALFSSGD